MAITKQTKTIVVTLAECDGPSCDSSSPVEGPYNVPEDWPQILGMPAYAESDQQQRNFLFCSASCLANFARDY